VSPVELDDTALLITNALSVPAVPPAFVKFKVNESSLVALDDLAIVVAASRVIASDILSQSIVLAVMSALTTAPNVGVVPPCNICVDVPAVACANTPEPFVYITPPLEENPENVIVPEDVIPVSPVKAPPVDTSHDVVSIATVFEFPPIVTAPDVEPVPIAVVAVDALTLIDVEPPEIVNPPVPRIKSAAVAVSRVVPERDQYPIVPDVGAVEVKFFEPSVYTALDAVNPEKLIVPLDVIPVAPVIAPADDSANVGVLMKLVKPVAEAKFRPLITFELLFDAALKLIPLRVFELFEFVAFVRVRSYPLTAIAEALVFPFVTAFVSADEAAVFENVWANTPVPDAIVRPWLAAIEIPPLNV
jgi:hypothetical protein